MPEQKLNSDLQLIDTTSAHIAAMPLLGTVRTSLNHQYKIKKMINQPMLFEVEKTKSKKTVSFEYVESIIGSGYEGDVSKLAIEDKVAYRAARKNMQIHSAIILKINDEFSGFFTFQVNHIVGEFCLLQSAMSLGKEDKVIYSDMLREIIKQNTYGYPMIMTVSTKHKLECPKVLEGVGFKTYLNLSGYEYMVYGTFEQVRMKRLAHATSENDNANILLSMINLDALKKIFKNKEFTFYLSEYKKAKSKNEKVRKKLYPAYSVVK